MLSGTLTAPMRAAANQLTTNAGAVRVEDGDPGAGAGAGAEQGSGQLGRAAVRLGVGETLVVDGQQHVLGPDRHLGREQ